MTTTPPLGQSTDFNWMGKNTPVHEKTYHSFSGCDIRAVCFNTVTGKLEELANIQTISYSVHREKFPVRSLGTTHVKQYTRGPRTIAGSLIFTVFNTSVLSNFLGLSPTEMESGLWRPITVDQIPPFHITLLFASEYNVLSSMSIYNVEIVNEGQVMSIEDLITENTCQYVATYLSPVKPVTEETAKGIALRGRTFGELMSQPIMQELFRARDPFDGLASGPALDTLNKLKAMTGRK